MKRQLIKTVSLVLLLVLCANTCCYGLATLPASQNPIAKREIKATLQRTQIRYAESEDALKLLNANNSECVLLSSGKYLVTKQIAQDDLSLLRAIVHEDIEAVMQILAKQDRYKYQGIKGLILTHFPPDKHSNLPIALYVNHIVARAFEWLSLIEEGVLLKDEIAWQYVDFINAVKPIINANKHNCFTEEFWNARLREAKIKTALNKGMIFYQVANAEKNMRSIEDSKLKPIKLLLIDLSSPRHEINEALGIEVIAGYIKKYYGKNVDIKIIDMQFGDTVNDILKKIKSQPVDIIGLSVKIGSYQSAKKFLDAIFLKRFSHESKPLVVLGNTVATFAHKKLLDQYKDAIVSVGEGEDALLGIATVLNEKVPQEHRTNVRYIKEKLIEQQVPNIAVNIDGKIVKTLRRQVDLNQGVRPARHTIYNVIVNGGIVSIEGSRGCPWGRCAFCTVKNRFKGWRPYPIGKIIGELEGLSKKTVKNVYFVDEDFIGPNIKRAEELGREIVKAKKEGRINPEMRFSISTRVIAVFLEGKEGENKKRKELFQLLKEAGLYIVFLGIESGSDSQLRRFNKGVTAEYNKQAVVILNELGIIVEPGFIMFDPLMNLDELKENIDFLESTDLANTTSRVTGELRVQAGSEFVDILGCSEDDLDLNSLSYPSNIQDQVVGRIYKEFIEWENQTKHVVYYLQGITRGNLLSYERNIAGQSLIKLRRLNLDFLKECVEIKGDTSKIDNLRMSNIGKRNEILRELLYSINKGVLPASDSFIENELIKSIMLGQYDTEFATILLSDLLYTQLHEDRIYEIKYDVSRLTPSQTEIIEEYARLLQLRSSNPYSIKLRPFSIAQGSKESLIAVYCTGKNFKGEGHVDVAIPDGELKEYVLRIAGMVNIALASSNIPDNLSKEEVDKYRPIMSYIKNQYKAIVGEELAIPDSPEDTLKVIRRIVLGLPKSMRMNMSQIEEFNKLAKQALTAA